MPAPSGRARLGIDLGGTKIAGIVLDSRGATLAEARVPAPRGDYRGTLEALAALVERLESEAGTPSRAPCSVGVGMPGSLSPATGLVRNANSHWLNGHPFGIDLARRLDRPVRIENDANCLAVSEAVDGAGSGARVVWAVILGTGVGSGIAIDGRVLTGRNGIAGEWGHGPLPAPTPDERPGPDCYCGRRGCVETWLSGPGLAADHARRHGRHGTAEAVVSAARDGDGDARKTLATHLDRLGRAAAQVVNLLDPDVIVIGGGLSRIPELIAGLPGAIAPHVFSDAFDTPVRASLHGDASGVRGAAWLWEAD
ncbi:MULTISPECIES: ROK family protein [Methylobacterium]|uniref:ROK family protein n=2 Tax=Methylobacteriaceae TaxID=119045 RepID=UPI0011C7ADB9|nr:MULTISPECIES: ROK family protein [Methylobacterium]TXN46768.1 ROK family protein [Methylobacterium sp. WL7]GJE21919.1 Fructokinase [Methylobacterium mesophilicum]